MRNGLIRLSRAALCVAACFGVGSTAAAPTLPKVVAGQASFSQDGNVFSITNTPGTIINWQSFSVNAGEITRFIQQSSDSAVLNRIVGQDPSRILGALQSNGRVFLINPNGVIFGQNARVDVNGLVASTLNMSDADFLAGKKNFTAGPHAGSVRNEGAITTPSGGKVFLVAPNVENSGVITAPNGEVVLAAGRSVQLVDSSNPDLTVVVSAPTDQAINLGQVVASGGRIGIYGALVNQRGVVNANSAVVGQDGKIVLKASKDAVLEQGSVTSAVGSSKGGEIQLLGERVALNGNAQVDASGAAQGGSVLVGGDYQGKNAQLPNAQQTVFGKDAVIRADATNNGKGGKVVLWSDGATSAHGSISARGAGAGNGGLVETSGRALDIAGIRVDAGAGKPGARTGTWLIDPTNLVIGETGSALDTTYIAATSLSANADIVLQATNNLDILQPITTAHNLRAEAGNELSVGAAVTSTAGSIDLRADKRIKLLAGGLLASPNYIDLKSERMTLTGNIGGVNNVLPVISFNPFNNATEIDVRVGEATRNALYLDPNRLGAFGAYEINIGNSGQTGGVQFTHPLTMAGNLIVDTAYTININTQIQLTGENSQFLGTVHAPFGTGAMVSNVGVIDAKKKVSLLGADGLQIFGVLKSADIDLSAASGGIQIRRNPSDPDPNALTTRIEAGNSLSMRTEGSLYQQDGTLLQAPQLVVEAASVQMQGANQVGTLAARTTGGVEDSGNFEFRWSGDLKIGAVGGVTGLSSPGEVSLSGGGLRLDAGIEGHDLALDADAIGGSGLLKGDTLALTSRGGIGATTSALRTSVNTLSAANTASGSAPINIVNDRALTITDVVQAGSGNGGAISIESTGGLTVAATASEHPGVKTGSGNISLVTHSPMTILGKVSTDSGDVRLVADNGGLLTIGSGGKVSSLTGSVSVTAGDTAIATGGIEVSDPSKLSVVKTNPPPNPEPPPPPPPPPPLDTCLSSPNTSGCGSVIEQATRTCMSNPEGPQCTQVLPTVPACRDNPTRLGCTVVLQREEIRQCILSPKAPGCGGILPTYDICEKSPGTYGCAPVIAEREAITLCIANPKGPGCGTTLPPYDICEKTPGTYGCAPVIAEHDAISQCIANPKAPGCGSTLPTWEMCEKTPGTYGCVPVIAERNAIAQCIATPKAPGCGAILPAYDTCEKTPGTYGCVPVIAEHNAITQCIATPKAPGCGSILPVWDVCEKSPGTYGCAPVIAERNAIAQCIATPKGPGCAITLPSWDVCEKSPSTYGCVPVIAERTAIAACIATPKAPGCGEILPPLATCRANAGVYGCVPVIERAEFLACVANPTASGCAARLPALAVCKATPGIEGCAQVLQVAFDICLVSPNNASCTGILPTLSQCVADKSINGCQVVLPTLQQCIGSPTLQGCSVQLPKLEQCAANPSLQGCEAVLPKPDFCSTHPTDPSCVVFNPGTGQTSEQKKPVATAQQTTVNLINTSTTASQGKLPGTPAPVGGTAGSGSGEGGAGGGKPSEQSENQAGPASGTNSGVKNEKPATKMYCN